MRPPGSQQHAPIRRGAEAWAEGLALLAVIAAPLSLGMAHLSTTLLVSGVGLVALLLLAIARVGALPQPGPLVLSLLLLCCVIALQLVPIPPGLLRAVAPESMRLAELTLGPAPEWDRWRPLSLDTPATAGELAKWLGWAAISWVLHHRAETARGARRRVYLSVALSAALVAALGFGHFFVGEKRELLGLYQFQASNAFRSTFGNANHLAGFLDLGGLLALGLAAAARGRLERAGWAALFVACAAGTFLSASRGGFVALIAGAIVLLALGWGSSRRRSEEEGWRSWLTLGGAVAAATGVAVWIYLEFPRLLREIATLLELDASSEEGKLEALSMGWRAALAHWPTGIGKGAFATVGGQYQVRPFPRSWFTHVENEPVQALAELGIPAGAFFVLVGAALWLGVAWKGRRSWVEAGAAAGLFALALQNLVDFSLQHACGLAAVALLSVATARQGGGRARFPLRQPLGAVFVAASLIAFGFAARASWPGPEVEGDRLLAVATDSSLPSLEEAAYLALMRRPGDSLPVDLMATRILSEPGEAKDALPWINRLRQVRPHDARGHLLAGVAFAELGNKGQSLQQFRRAAILGVPTIGEVAVRFPDSRSILQGAPSEGEPARRAALQLASLGRGGDGLAVALRALERSPQDDGLLAVVSSLQASAGLLEEALETARERRELHPELEGGWAAEASLLSRLGRKDDARERYVEGLRRLSGAPSLVLGLARLELSERQPEEALRALAQLRRVVPPATRASYHELRARAFRQQRSLLRARDELRLAVRLAPNNESWRVALFDVLLELGRVDEAARELEGLDGGRAVEAARERLERRRAQEEEEREALQRERLERSSRSR